MTIKEMLNMGADNLQKAGVVDFQLDGWYLLSYYMGISKSEYYMRMNETVTDDCYKEYMALIAKRAERVPLQHITGEQEFYGLNFVVNEHVLVPRQDTEVLVEFVLPLVDEKNVLDMCTGSGCIAVTIAACGKPGKVHASDISDKALETAKINANNNNTDIIFIKSDIYENIFEKYDIIISNPPYIADDDIKTLQPEVRDHDPYIALSGGPDGLYFYRKIIDGLDEHLADDGLICFEIGCDQADDVSELLKNKGFGTVNVIKDLAGLDRVVWGRR